MSLTVVIIMAVNVSRRQTLCVLILACLLQLSSCAVSSSRGRRIEEGSIGTLYVYKIDRAKYFEDDNDPVQFRASSKGRASLPEWLRLYQRNLTSSAFLYGIPRDGDTGLHVIEIVGISKDSYDTAHKKIKIKVSSQKHSDQEVYQLDLYISNKNVEDMLDLNVMLDLVSRVKTQSVWRKSRNDLHVTGISAFQSHGNPGTLVQLSSTVPISNSLERTLGAVQNNCQGGTLTGTVPIDSEFSPEFIIDWCKLMLSVIEPSTEETIDDMSSQITPIELYDDAEFQPPRRFHPPRDFFLDIFLAIVVPCTVLLFVVITLACIFCSFREGQTKRDKHTSEVQLAQYDNVKSASNKLRRPSDYTESLGTPYGDRQLNNNLAPPPYQVADDRHGKTVPHTRNEPL